jgi:signal transduction histidine kinase/ActR/RegA family two-component response regulator
VIAAIQEAFPLSAVLSAGVIRRCTPGFTRVTGAAEGHLLRSFLRVVRPRPDEAWENLSGRMLVVEVAGRPEVQLRAQVVAAGNELVFLATPLLTRLEDLELHGYTLADFGPLDATPDLLMLSQAQAQTSAQLEKTNADLREVSRALVARNAELARALEARQRAEQHLLQAQKLELLGQLVGGVTHDFNNLLVAILACASVGLEEAREPVAREALEGVRDAAQRASELTRRLLSFARKAPVSAERAEVTSEIASLRRLLDRLIGNKVQIEVDVAKSAMWTDLDRTGLEQILVNLAVNARDAMPDGGTLWITARPVSLVGELAEARGVPPGRYVLLAVSDTGSGMPPEVQARIFEPFYTTKPDGKGTGLGLATVLGLVKSAHGVLAVKSRIGEGTTFEILLPRRRQKAGQAVLAPAAARQMLRGAHVLIVDDERQVRHALARVLERAGCRVAQADGVAEALALADRGFEVALIDVHLGSGSGVDLAQTLLERRPELAVAVMTGGATDPRLRQAVRAGLYRLLPKPFETDRLLGVLAALRQGADPSTSDLALVMDPISRAS